MTIINPNSISGITSFTAEADVMNFYRSNGTLGSLQLNGVNFNTTNGISTFNNLNVGGVLTYEDVKNVDSVGIISARTAIHVGAGISAVGIITGTSFRGDGSQLTGITQVGGATTVGFDDNKSIYFGSQDDYRMGWSGTVMSIVPTSSSTTHQLEIVSNNQMYINSKASGLFLKSGNQNVIDIYGGYGGGIYFKNNNTQYLKLEYSNWTFLNNTEVRIPDKLVHAGDENTSIRFPAADTVTVETAGSERVRITSAGLISIGDNTNLDSQLTVTQTQGDCIRLRSVVTNNAFKYGIIKQEPYNNNALGVQIIGGKSDSGYSEVAIGGGIDGGYAATQIDFYTGATTTTATGTRRFRIDSSGNASIGGITAAPTSTVYNSGTLHLHQATGGASGGSQLKMTTSQSGSAAGDGAYLAYYGNNMLYIYNRENAGIQFGTNATERLNITSTGQLLVGTSSSSDQFHFLKSHNSHTRLVVQNNWGGNATAQLKLISPTDEFALVKYASGDAHVSLSNSANIKFNIGGTERIEVQSTGHLKINDGDLVIGTAGHGIDFSAQTQSSSTTDDELLDHYEKGKWTPVMKKNGVANATPDIYHGRYVRVGKKVWLSCYMRWNSGSNAQGTSGGWTLHGLPFSIQDDNPGTCRIYQFAPIGYFTIDSDGSLAYGHDSRWQCNNNTYFDLYTDISSSDLAWGSGSMMMAMTGTFMIHE